MCGERTRGYLIEPVARVDAVLEGTDTKTWASRAFCVRPVHTWLVAGPTRS